MSRKGRASYAFDKKNLLVNIGVKDFEEGPIDFVNMEVIRKLGVEKSIPSNVARTLDCQLAPWHM